MRKNRRREHLPPARDVIAKFRRDRRSGVTVLSDILGMNAGLMYFWMYEKNVGGTGGLIPSRYHGPILRAAREAGIALTAAELIGDDNNTACAA